ncbi:MAG: hypothetical protein QM710_13890 [Flavobacterium sp.]
MSIFTTSSAPGKIAINPTADMKLIFCLLLTSTLFGQNADCLKYEQKIFDSDTCCWRKLSKENQFEKAAGLIADYLKNGKAENRQSLNWHAGQLFAFAGENKKALRYFGKTYSVFQKWFGGEDGKAWYFFAKGTSAFIKKDRPKLEKIIKKWEAKLPLDANYSELNALKDNWGKDYRNATFGNRRPAH